MYYYEVEKCKVNFDKINKDLDVKINFENLNGSFFYFLICCTLWCTNKNAVTGRN